MSRFGKPNGGGLSPEEQLVLEGIPAVEDNWYSFAFPKGIWSNIHCLNMKMRLTRPSRVTHKRNRFTDLDHAAHNYSDAALLQMAQEDIVVIFLKQDVITKIVGTLSTPGVVGSQIIPTYTQTNFSQ